MQVDSGATRSCCYFVYVGGKYRFCVINKIMIVRGYFKMGMGVRSPNSALAAAIRVFRASETIEVQTSPRMFKTTAHLIESHPWRTPQRATLAN
jgi:hypothetical protein